MAGLRSRGGTCPWGALAALAAAAALLPSLAQPPASADASRRPRELRMDQAWLQVRHEGLAEEAEALAVSWLSDACHQKNKLCCFTGSQMVSRFRMDKCKGREYSFYASRRSSCC